MKTTRLMLAAALAALTFASCEKEEGPHKEICPVVDMAILTFEDEDWKATPYTLNYCNKEVKTWSDLIAPAKDMDSSNPEGNMLYGGNDTESYNWYDEGNTFIKQVMAPQYWTGGHAVSSYITYDLENAGMPEQISVWLADKNQKNGGHDSSRNFCVHYGFGSSFSQAPFITFGDDKARVIDHMWVNNTANALNIIKNGNDYSPKFTEKDFLKIVATGFNGDQETGKAEFFLAKGTDFVTEWTKWDLSGLGKVTKVVFDFDSTQKNEFGLTAPAYFAYDDVAVCL